MRELLHFTKKQNKTIQYKTKQKIWKRLYGTSPLLDSTCPNVHFAIITIYYMYIYMYIYSFAIERKKKRKEQAG